MPLKLTNKIVADKKKKKKKRTMFNWKGVKEARKKRYSDLDKVYKGQ